MAGITRRQFIIGTGAAAASGAVGAATPAWARMMGGGGMTGTTLIDPPVSGPFVDPPLAAPATAGDLFEVGLEARLATLSIGGKSATVMTYNGMRPGPTIRVRKDQKLRIRMKNSLPNDGTRNMLGHPVRNTNLHTHGLHVSPGDNPPWADGTITHADNMMVMLKPGESTIYEYDLSKHPGGNLNFYHPHLHGSVADQMWAGMAGALVVEDTVTSLSAFEEHLLVLQDINVVNGGAEPHDSMMDYMHGLEGSTVTVNGRVNPRMAIRPGQVQRWRIVNASVARFYRLALANHSLYLVGTEGGLLDKPYQMSEILLSPGERVDVLVKADKAASSYKFLSLPYSRMGNMGSQQVTLMTLTYGGTRFDQQLPAVVDPSAMRMSMDPAMMKRVSMALSMGQGAGYINGVTFKDHENTYSTSSMLGHHEIWEIVNNSGMDHPFHQHVNHVQVLSITGGDAGYRTMCLSRPAWKDTVIVPKWGKVELLVPVEDFEGMTMFHCHIIEHEDIGMMGVWHIGHHMG